MPSVLDIRTKSLLSAAAVSKDTAAANTVAANAAADAAAAAIDTAVRAAGYYDFCIESGVVKVADRLRGWSAGGGVLPTSYSSIGLSDLVTSHTAARALQMKRDNELAGLQYVIAQVNSLLAHGIDKEPTTTAAADFATLSTMLGDITASMAE